MAQLSVLLSGREQETGPSESETFHGHGVAQAEEPAGESLPSGVWVQAGKM